MQETAWTEDFGTVNLYDMYQPNHVELNQIQHIKDAVHISHRDVMNQCLATSEPVKRKMKWFK